MYMGLAHLGTRGIVVCPFAHGLLMGPSCIDKGMLQTGASNAHVPARTSRRMPVLEMFSLLAAACAALAFLPYVLHNAGPILR